MVFQSRSLGKLEAARKIGELRKGYMPLGQYRKLFASKLKKDPRGALDVLREALRYYGEDPGFLNEAAWILLTEKGLSGDRENLRLALELAEKAVRMGGGGEGSILDTLALALFKNGRPARALAVQEKALGLMPGSADLRKRLLLYRKALERK